MYSVNELHKEETTNEYGHILAIVLKKLKILNKEVDFNLVFNPKHRPSPAGHSIY